MNNEFIRLCEDYGAIWLREVLDVSTVLTMTEARQVGRGERVMSLTDTTSVEHSSRGQTRIRIADEDAMPEKCGK
jgi:hypothetical protein